MKKVIVVGAGVSGLSAGIYAALAGFDVTVCEKHRVAGGNLTGRQAHPFKRKTPPEGDGINYDRSSDRS